MKNSSYLIILILIFCSCTSQKVIHGVYSENWYDTYHSISLNPDKTFNFIFKEGLLFDSISGNWSVSKNKLILNSSLTIHDTKSFLEERKCDTCQKGINICVVDFKSKNEMQYVSISAFKQEKIITEVATNENGNAIIKNQEVDSINVDFVGYNSFTFVPSNDYNKIFVINMKLEELKRYVMTNEVWKIKKDRIVSPEGLILMKN